MKKLKIAYFGTPSFSARFLEKLLTDRDIHVEVTLVITQPDKPVGKKQILTSSPVKLVAEKYKIPVKTGIETEVPRREPDSAFHRRGSKARRLALSEVEGDQSRQAPFFNIDLGLLFAYGKILPKKILSIPNHGFWNIHPSLLPKYRGPSPMVYPLLLGDKITGTTLMKMDELMDQGPIIDQESLTIGKNDYRVELENKLTDLGYEVFKRNVNRLAVSGVKSVRFDPQDDTLATYTKLLTKQDGFIPLPVLKQSLINDKLNSHNTPQVVKEYLKKNNLTIEQFNHLTVYNIFRGLSPWPGLFTEVVINDQKKRLKITGLSHKNDTLIVDRVQLEGKKEVDFVTFNRAYRVF